MPKRISENQKKEILDNFLSGSSLKDLSIIYNFSVQTISKQLKRILNDDEFKNLKLKNNKKNISKNKEKSNISDQIDKTNPIKIKKESQLNSKINLSENITPFYAITPLNIETNFEQQNDISTKPLSELKFTSVVYLIVNKNIELEFKLLKEYSEWSFLPSSDQNRMVLKIYDEQKNAKINCQKDEKLIKVPNPDVFFIVSNILKSRGVSRLIFKDSIFSI